MPERPQSPRDVLPVPDIAPVGHTTYDAKDPETTFPPIEPLRPPEGAPNVLVVLIDDVGFGASSGLKYNRFHTTALCSPTRAAPVLAHGLTAAPLANRYATWYESHPRDALPGLESSEVRDVRWRFGVGHSRVPDLRSGG